MAVRMLKHKWEPAVRDLYAGQWVQVYEAQDILDQYLCEFRSGPLTGEFRWMKEADFLPETRSQIGVSSEQDSQ